MWSMLVQTRLDKVFKNSVENGNYGYGRGPKFTIVVPSNAAWEKAQMNFNKAYNTIQEGNLPQYVSIKVKE